MKNTLKKVSALLLAGVLTIAASSTAYAASATTPSNGSSSNGFYGNGSFICGTSINGSCGLAPVVAVDSATFGASINAAAKGDSVFTTIKVGEVVTADVWKDARENGTRVVLRNGTTTWTFGTLTNDVDFNPTMYAGNQLPAAAAEAIANAPIPADVKYVPLSFAHHGNLPGAAEVTIDLSTTGLFYGGQIVYLYYLNPATNSFEFIDSAEYYSSATFTMTHCSEYIVTGEKLAGTSLKTSAKTSDVTNATVYAVILLAGVALVAVSSKKKALR